VISVGRSTGHSRCSTFDSDRQATITLTQPFLDEQIRTSPEAREIDGPSADDQRFA
jgi:hypothetical protein